MDEFDDFTMVGGEVEDPSPARICLFDGCTTSLEGTHGAVKYCPAHKPRPHGPSRKKRKDSAPRSVTNNINLGTPKSRSAKADKEMEAVRTRAKSAATAVCILLSMVGKDSDALHIMRGSDAWAQSVSQLSEHEEWIRKLAQGGESSERALAWLQFVLATGAIALPILIDHKVITGKLAELLAGLATVAGEPIVVPDQTAETTFNEASDFQAAAWEAEADRLATTGADATAAA
jgi:hypothetical protein